MLAMAEVIKTSYKASATWADDAPYKSHRPTKENPTRQRRTPFELFIRELIPQTKSSILAILDCFSKIEDKALLLKTSHPWDTGLKSTTGHPSHIGRAS